MIRGLGHYSAQGVEDFREGRDWNTTVLEALPRLRDLRQRTLTEPGSFVWLGLFEPTHANLEAVAEVFDLPELQIDDAANAAHRPMLEWTEDGRIFVVVKVLDYVDASSDVHTGQVAIFIGPGYAITVRFGNTGNLSGMRARLADDAELRAIGSLSVLYAVLDSIVDGYLHVTNEIETDIENIEADVFVEKLDKSVTPRLYRLKRENIEIRRAVAPMVASAQEIISSQPSWTDGPLAENFRDIAEHLLRAYDTVEWADNLLHSLLEAATQMQGLQQNSDMRKISAWVAIAAVPTMIAGIYGMNFEFMPELHFQWGYPAVATLMVGACAGLFTAFKRSGWL